MKLGEEATSENLSWQFCAVVSQERCEAGAGSSSRSEGGGRYLDLGVIGCDAEPDQAEGHGQGLVHVDLCAVDQGHDAVRGVEAGGAGADDGHPEGPVMPGGGRCRVVARGGA